MRNYFTFNSNVSTSYGVYISGDGVFNSPEREYQTIAVPGRNGDFLGIERRLGNVKITYPAFIYTNFDTNLANLKAMLLSSNGYCRLTDTYHPNEFRKAFFSGPIEVMPTAQKDAGQFDITFEAKPQRWLTSGESVTTITTSGTNITNPTLFPAQPLIRVYGYGQFYVGSDRITITNVYSYIDIDCEMMDCYYGTVNCNDYVTFQNNNFPTLPSGATGITFPNTITKIEITPRWWMV